MITSIHNLRAYYSSTIKEFLNKPNSEIFGIIHSNDVSAETTIQQSNTWEQEIIILKDQLRDFSEGRIIFEYTIPRKGKRVDVIVIYKNIVFVIEFKCGDSEYRQSTYDQVYDYALDLRNFQKQSHDKLLVPIMVSTRAQGYQFIISDKNRIIEPLRCNSSNIAFAIHKLVPAIIKFFEYCLLFLVELCYKSIIMICDITHKLLDFFFFATAVCVRT